MDFGSMFGGGGLLGGGGGSASKEFGRSEAHSTLGDVSNDGSAFWAANESGAKTWLPWVVVALAVFMLAFIAVKRR